MSETGVFVRVAAARAIAAVISGRSLDTALREARAGLAAADAGLAAAIAFGTVREHRLLDALARPLLRRPPSAAVHALVLAGLFQLRSMRVPAHAAVHATVSAAAPLGQPRARGLVNAVLRRYQREQARLEAALPDAPGVRTSHPDWLVACLRRDWPQSWCAVLDANNRPAPMTLRVNRRRIERDAYLAQLAEAGMDAVPHAYAEDAVILAESRPVAALPGFDEGRVSVQDAAAQLAAPLLAIEPGMRVLDACAAPGGKTAHSLERADCELLALDIDAERLAAVAENLARLGLEAATRCGDAARPEAWWDGKPFDRILVDAPCTGTGVIRRHPDIKWLRRKTDAGALASRQRALLDALWPLLAPGGRLVYATCSTLRAEGAEVVVDFLANTPGATEDPINADWGEAETVGRRIAPGDDDMDGFYYCCVMRDA